MAQFALVVSSAADLDLFDTIGSISTYAFVDDAGTPAIQLHTTSTDTAAALVTSLSNSTQVDVYVRWRAASTSGGPVRTHGAAISMYRDAATQGYGAGTGLATGGVLTKFSENTSLASATVVDSTSYIWTRGYRDGSAVKAKYWSGTLADEPGGLGSATDWTFEATDTDKTAGRPGVYSHRIASGPGLYMAEIYAGTDGDAAPTGPVGGAPELSSPSASSITANSIIPNVTLTF